MQVYWGTSGFSLRVKDTKGKATTIFYGFPVGSSGKDSAIIQGYVGNIENIEYRNTLRQRFLQIPGTTQSGQYTVSLDLNANTIESANKLIRVIWELNAELSK